MPYIFLAVALHECGHFALIRLCGLKVTKIQATILGFAITTNAGLSSYLSEIAVALAGPFASILAAVCASCLASLGYFPDGLYFFSGLNILFGLINLLPASKLDGGRALFACLNLLAQPDTAYRVAYFVHVLTAVLVILAGGFILYATKYNLSLLLIGIWLLVSSRPE